jgi:hypothetical protein
MWERKKQKISGKPFHLNIIICDVPVSSVFLPSTSKTSPPIRSLQPLGLPAFQRSEFTGSVNPKRHNKRKETNKQKKQKQKQQRKKREGDVEVKILLIINVFILISIPNPLTHEAPAPYPFRGAVCNSRWLFHPVSPCQGLC